MATSLVPTSHHTCTYPQLFLSQLNFPLTVSSRTLSSASRRSSPLFPFFLLVSLTTASLRFSLHRQRWSSSAATMSNSPSTTATEAAVVQPEPQQEQEQQQSSDAPVPNPHDEAWRSITKEAGVCPVKAMYLRPAPARVSLDAEGRTRGMNKGSDRERSSFVAGTERPTLEGETNLFHGATLQRIKKVMREQRSGGGPAAPAATATTLTVVPVGVEGGEGAAATAVPTSLPVDEGSSDHGDAVGAKRPRPPSPVPPSTAQETTTVAATAPQPAGVAAVNDMTRGLEMEDVARPSHSAERLRDVEARRSASRGLFCDKLVLAPLTTVGNLPFRRICKGFGADVTISEMAVVYNLNRLQKSEWSLLRRHQSEDIFGIQLAVSRPQEAASFAKALEAADFSYDFLDINCGCPVEKIVKSGCGCGLWERTGRLRDVVESLSLHQSRPVAVKCRIGPDEDAPSLHRQISQYESWGAAAVTIHGRSRKQRYTKLANWDYVEQCAQLTSLPIIGNGDIMSVEDLMEHRRLQPHISSHMIGRAALIKPWIFQEIKSGQAKDISSSERLDILKEFCRCGLAHWGADARGVMTTRRFLCEWLSFLHRYVPVGLLERLPQRMNERPPFYEGRDALETLMASDSVADWIRISELLLGPVEPMFRFTPKHKSNSYANVAQADGDAGVEPEG